MNRRTLSIGICALSAMLLAAPGRAAAQGARLQLDGLTALAGAASEVTDVTLDPGMLQLAGGFLSDSEPSSPDIKELLAGLKGVYVKSFEFDREDAYDAAAVDAVRKQLAVPGWTRIVATQSRQESVDVYSWRDGNQPGGLAIIVVEPKEITVVNLVGNVDLGKLAALQGKMGIPKLPAGK